MQSTTHAFGHYCAIISISNTIHWHLFSNFSPFHSPLKEKGKQGRMKGLTMTQCINLNLNKRFVLVDWYSVLWQKTGPILLPLMDPMASWKAGRLAGRPVHKIWVRSKLNHLRFYFVCYHCTFTTELYVPAF